MSEDINDIELVNELQEYEQDRRERLDAVYAEAEVYYRFTNRIKRGSKIVLKAALWILVFFIVTCIISIIPSDPERDRDYYEENTNRLW